MTRTMDILLQHGRALEWLTNSIMLGFAITPLLPCEPLVSGGWTAPSSLWPDRRIGCS